MGTSRRAIGTRTAAWVLVLGTAAGASPMAHATPPPQAADGPDLLTFARGVLFVEQTGLSSGNSGAALLAIDGDPYRMGLTRDDAGPVSFVYKMPAETTFERFAVPAVVEQPGNATFVKLVTVEGSLEGPDGGFTELAAFELETHGPDQEVTELAAAVVTPVRWVRVRFEGGIHIEPGDEGRTVVWFSEIQGYGTQADRALSDAFDGTWDLRLTERTDLRGTTLALEQDGTTLTGCYGDVPLVGTVNGAIAKASGENADGRRSALILVADDDGTLQASVSGNGGRFGARTAVSGPEVPPTECDAPPPPTACGTNVYVNFDLDSARIRPESEPVLADVYRRLVAEGATRVSVVGHTSTEGAEDYNLDLSQRRAQAVVDDLVARGFDRAAISAVGMGEREPLITPDANESARELNRRVAIGC